MSYFCFCFDFVLLSVLSAPLPNYLPAPNPAASQIYTYSTPCFAVLVPSCVHLIPSAFFVLFLMGSG